MSIKEKTSEIQRLIESFETEAGKFHDLNFFTYFITQKGESIIDRTFDQPNHCIMLWQYYGMLDTDEDIEDFVANLNNSNLQWGLRGTALTFMGLIEGDATPLFVRMAIRAGNLFNDEEARFIKSRVVSEIQEKEKTGGYLVNPQPLQIQILLLFG